MDKRELVYSMMKSIAEEYDSAIIKQQEEAYLRSDVHRYFLTAETGEEMCKNSIARVLKGGIYQRTIFCCCEDCFVKVLSSGAKWTYKGCCSELSPNDEFWDGVDPYAAPLKKGRAALKRFLSKNGFNAIGEMEKVYIEDVRRRNNYVGRFRRLMNLAAKLAKKRGAFDIAMELIEATRLTYLPNAAQSAFMTYNDSGPLCSREEAQYVYMTATHGLARLWDYIYTKGL